MTFKIKPHAVAQDNGPFIFPGAIADGGFRAYGERDPNLRSYDDGPGVELYTTAGTGTFHAVNGLSGLDAPMEWRGSTLTINSLGYEFLKIEPPAPALFEGQAYFNRGQRDWDFHFNSAAGPDALFIEGSTGDVYVSQDLNVNGDIVFDGDQAISAPGATLTIQGADIAIPSTTVFNSAAGGNSVAVLDGSGEFSQLLQLDGGNGWMRVGVYVAGGEVAQFGHGLIHFNDGERDQGFRVDSASGTHALFVRGSDGNVGVGHSDPYYNFVVGDGSLITDAVIALRSADANFGTIAFGDADSGAARYAGYMEYNHADGHLYLGAETEIIMNEAGVDTNFRVETADRPDIFYADGEGAGFAAIGTTTQAPSKAILTIEDDTLYSTTGTVGQAGIALKTDKIETGTFSQWLSFQFTDTSALTDLTLNVYMDPETKSWHQYDPTKLGGAIYQQWIDNDRVRHQWYTYITGSYHLGAEYDVVPGGQTAFYINFSHGDCDFVVSGDNLDDLLYTQASTDQVYIGGKSGLDTTFQFGIQQRAASGPLAQANAGFVLGDIEGWGADPLFTMQYLDYVVGGWAAVLGVIGMNLYHDNSTDNWILPDASQDGVYLEMITRTNDTDVVLEAGYALATGGVAALVSMFDGYKTEFVFNEQGVDRDFRVESAVDTHQLFVQGSDGYIGIGTDSPRWNLNLVKDAGNLVLAADVYSATPTVRPLFILAHGSGSEASPAVTVSGFNLGEFAWAGWNGSALVGGAAIKGYATENYGAAARGSLLGFYTTDNGTTTNDERLRIDQDGGIFAYNLLAAAASTDVNINGSDELHSVTSSKRFKKNIQPLDMRFDSSLVYDLEPRSFIWRKNTGNPGMVDFGLVAEEAYKIFPALVNLDADEKPYSIRYSMLSVLLLEEVQKLNRRLEAVESG